MEGWVAFFLMTVVDAPPKACVVSSTIHLILDLQLATSLTLARSLSL